MSTDLEKVMQDGYALQFVRKQTPELCLAAVKQEGYALQCVSKQTPAICLAAVTQDGYALHYVKEQTPEICLAAVKQHGWALKYVKEQTPEICLAAVKQDGLALQFVKEQTPEICLAAVNPWLVLAGVQPHGIIPQRPKTAKHFQGAVGYKPPTPRTVTLVSAHKKTRRGIRACLRAGMLSNYEIRMKLIERGFYITRHGAALYPSRFNAYVRLIREQLGLVRRAKKEWVLSMWDEGHEIAHIIQRLNTNEDYVIQVLRRDGRVMGLTKTEGRDATNT